MTKEPMATGVVLAYKRLENIPLIVAEMLASSFIKEVIVWNNSEFKSWELAEQWGFFNRVLVTGRGRNCVTLGRFKAAREAREAAHPLIATCDDDVHVTAAEWNHLLGIYREEKRLTCYLDLSHLTIAPTQYAHKHAGGVAHETLLGYGSIFERQATEVLQLYRRRFSEDELLQRKADRLFTILLNQPHALVQSTVKHLPGAWSADMALFLKPDHEALNGQARDRAVEILNSLHAEGKCSSS